MDSNNVFERISATHVDGRCCNIIYRQKALLKLHKSIKKHAKELISVVHEVHGTSFPHVCADLAETLDAVAADYDSVGRLRNTPSDRQETSVAIPVGNVVVVFDDKSTPIHNALAALGAAIASGSTCILCPSSGKTKIVEVLQKCVKTIDTDSYVIVDECMTSIPKSFELGAILLQDAQAGERLRKSVATDGKAHRTRVLDCYSGPCLAIVDRTADVQVAANQIVASKMFNGGQSDCAPQALLVHEFIRHEFLMALMAAASKADAVRLEKQNFSAVVEYMKQPEFGENGTTLRGKVDSQRCMMSPTIVDGVPLSAISSVKGPLITITYISSLDDAIDSYNKVLSSRLSCAAYIFASTSSANYLSRFVESVNTYVNQIPLSLQVGHVPIYGKTGLRRRYSTSMFSRQSAIEHAELHKMGSTPAPRTVGYPELLTIQTTAMGKEIREFHQPEGARTDFFVQGIKVMMSTVALTLAGTVVGAGFAGFKLYQKYSK